MTTQLYMAVAAVIGIAGLLAFPGAMGFRFRMIRLKFAELVLLLAMAAIGIIGYGDKFSPTNNPPNGLNQPMLMTFNPNQPMPTVTDADIARELSVVSVGANEVFDFTMPTDGVRVTKWWLRGGSNDKAFVPGGIAMIGGEILDKLPHPDVRHCPLKATTLLVAQESEFWYQETASNSTVYTWKDAYLWRNLLLPFSMQAEIFENGDFEYRYDLSRISDMDALTNVVIGAKFGTNELGDVSWLLDGTNTVTSIRMHRLSEFDWDGDGLANPIDPDPYTNGGDCHGTCVEWYNASCSNVLSATANTTGEIEISWNTNANQTAYYWLDLTVTGQTGVAMVTITCDGPSNLGDMMVVALTNQVCRVPMLAGATYAIYSTLPLGSVSASSQYAVVELCSATSATVSLPLAFSFAYVGPGGMPTANYVLQTSPMNVGAALASVLGTCCSCQTAGAGFSWVCSAACSCAGQTGHAIPSVATWEGYSYSFLDNAMCPCYYVEQEAVQQIATLGPSLDILDSLGNAISWKDPVLVGEDVQIEVVLQGNGMSVAEFVSLFGGRLRLKSWWVDSEGSHDISSVAVPVSVSTVVALSPTAFRVAVPASWLVANGLVRNGSDAIQSKTSIDMSASATGDSNRQDSDHVDANAPGRLHGRARGREQGNSVAAIPEGAFNLKTVRAAGTACLAATAGYVESDKKQCQQQADLVYYSGHGHHDTGDLNGIATPEQVSGWWHDVDAVVLAGCAVLDIGDKGNNYADSPSSHAASPGLKWLSASGASVLLGYAYYAPLDDKGGMEIVERWCAQRASLGDVEAWMKANDCISGHNACTIQRIDDSHFRYSYFEREKGFLYNTYTMTNVVESLMR